MRFHKDAAFFRGGRPGIPREYGSGGGSRLDVKPYISLPLEGASWFFKPTLAWRYTAYQVDDDYATALRVARIAHAQPADRAASTRACSSTARPRIDGRPYLQTLEPRLFYLNAPYRNQDDLPLFDTGALTFSWGQLFRDNRYSGADRQADANQLTLALTTRLMRESDGKRAPVGQHRPDPLFRRFARRAARASCRSSRARSAWVADVGWAPSDRWNLGASYQWNPKDTREGPAQRARPLPAARRRHRQPGLPLPPRRLRTGRLLLPVPDQRHLERGRPPLLLDRSTTSRWSRSLGVQWDSCCIAVRLVGRRYVHNREGDLSRGILLEIELKGLGSAGQDTRKTLRRAILGYNRGDLYLVPPETATGQPPTDPDPTP